jgi:hypothetical protein
LLQKVSITNLPEGLVSGVQLICTILLNIPKWIVLHDIHESTKICQDKVKLQSKPIIVPVPVNLSQNPGITFFETVKQNILYFGICVYCLTIHAKG